MTNRQRSITLDPGDPIPDSYEPGSLLVGVYRCHHTDLLYVRIRLGVLSFTLESEDIPATRQTAVEQAKTFLEQINFSGPVLWQIGGGSAITDKPHV